MLGQFKVINFRDFFQRAFIKFYFFILASQIHHHVVPSTKGRQVLYYLSLPRSIRNEILAHVFTGHLFLLVTVLAHVFTGHLFLLVTVLAHVFTGHLFLLVTVLARVFTGHSYIYIYIYIYSETCLS